MADFAILTMNLTDFVSFVRMCLHVPMQGLLNKKERTNAEQYVKVSNNVNEAYHHEFKILRFTFQFQIFHLSFRKTEQSKKKCSMPWIQL